jgi:hypothetical protein
MSGILKVRSRAGGEGGATVVIVALVLVALMGMLVLVVDVGGLLWKRRELVNGSDAAALAAASTCALKGTADPEAAADDLAMKNVTGLSSTGTINTSIPLGTCHTTKSGWVKVTYSQQQHLFFAPVLGFSNTNPVTTKATAIWGPAGAANPMPIVVYANSFNNCQLDTDPTNGPDCYIWEDNNNTQGSQSGFGFLDLRTDNPSRYGWDSVAGAQCPDPGGQTKGWIDGYPNSSVGDLPMNYPSATYVCRGSGLSQSAWSSLDALIGKTLLFPINRCDPVLPGNPFGQIASDTSEVACGSIPHQYDIIGFAALTLKAIYRPNQVQGSTNACGNVVQNFTAATGDIDLDALSGTCAPYDDITNLQLNANGNPNCCTLNTQYTYDPVTHVIHWQDGNRNNVTISWDVVHNGVCGVPPSGNNSGHCLIVQVADVQIGGTDPGNGDPNSNVRAVKLCDQAVSGSCDPISVPNP